MKLLNIGLIDEAKKREIQRRLISWGSENFEKFPWRSTANRFHALSAEIFLQRTRAEQVLPVYEEFCKRYSTPAEATAFPQDVQELLKTLGLRWRIPLFQELCRALAKNSRTVPETIEELRALPGVGDYASRALLSLHGIQRHAIIDSNVVRLYGRLLGFETHGETRRKRWFRELAEGMTPKEDWQAYNYALLDFTRKICRPKPLLCECPLRDICDYAGELHNK